jgi:phenylalanyl-tRNA synthetase beta subunit
MDISYKWLQKFIGESLPGPEAVADTLTHGAYEIEEVSEFEDDFIFDIDVLPNRASDSLGHEGVARELAALLGLSFNPVSPDLDTDKDVKTDENISLSIETDTCRRALKRLAIDVEVKSSPEWLQKQLSSLGQKSINNVVDITNYVMLELGQPVHAFDFDKLAGNELRKVFIRSASAGEEITTLDGDEFTLKVGMPVIADTEKALDIAGIKGGQMSGIDADTTRVMLSVCSFDPATIRKTSQKLNLRTDASKRFENDVPPAGARRALERFSELLQEVSGARISDDVCDVYPHVAADYKVGVTTDDVNLILGTDISQSEVLEILDRLGCDTEVVNPKETVLSVSENQLGAPYTYGASVLRDAPNTFDCSSFVSWVFVQAGIALPRISVDQFAYTERIQESNLAAGDIIFANTEKDEGGEIYHETKEYMTGTKVPNGVDHCGIYIGDGEVIHASRHNESGEVSTEPLAESNQFKNITGYGRVSGLNKERIVVTIPAWRTDLRCLQDLVEEVGRVYGYEKIQPVMPTQVDPVTEMNSIDVLRDMMVAAGYTEVKTYSLVDKGEIKLSNPVAEDKAYLRSTLRNNIDTVLDINKTHKPVLSSSDLKVFEIGEIFSTDEEMFSLAVGGDGNDFKDDMKKLFEGLSDYFDYAFKPEITDDVATVVLPVSQELSFEQTSGKLDTNIFTPVLFKTPSMYPYVLRDVAVWTPIGTESESVAKIIQDAAGDLLTATKLFDTYEKEDQISFAFKLVFQSDERTLSDKEVNEQMQAVEEALEDNNRFSVR